MNDSWCEHGKLMVVDVERRLKRRTPDVVHQLPAAAAASSSSSSSSRGAPATSTGDRARQLGSEYLCYFCFR